MRGDVSVVSGAGETRNRVAEFVTEGAQELEPNAGVRFYSRNGMLWAVHRSVPGEVRGFRSFVASLVTRILRWSGATCVTQKPPH
jgi:hypothetical protein